MLDELSKDNLDLARRIKDAISSLDLKKAEVAEMLSVSPQAITGWEKTGRIKKKTLAELSALTGLSVDHFLTGTPDRADDGKALVIHESEEVARIERIRALGPDSRAKLDAWLDFEAHTAFAAATPTGTQNVVDYPGVKPNADRDEHHRVPKPRNRRSA